MNKTVRVCWVPDQDDEGRPLRRQTWKDGRPKSAPPAENAPPVDLHSRERGGLMETLARLAGRIGGAVRRGGVGQRSAGGQQGGAGNGV